MNVILIKEINNINYKMDKLPTPSSSVSVYSKEGCKYCVMAKRLLIDNGIPFTNIVMDCDTLNYEEDKRALLLKTNGHTTFPFIFIGDEFLGGFSDLNHSVSTNLPKKLAKIGITFEPDIDF